MPELDQTARFALKIAPAESAAWLLPDLDRDLKTGRWLDTETIAFPGEPRRRCDTVLELLSESEQAPPWALVFEVEARPRATILDRLLEYCVRVLRKLRHGPRRRDRYRVAAVLLVLTGKQRDLRVEMSLPGTDVDFKWKARVVNLAKQSATGTLERIDRKELGRSVLVWVPLLAGGGDEGVATEWARLAAEEPDAQRRTDYVELALVFAEHVKRLPVWKKEVEVLKMEWKSQIIEARRQEGRLEEKRADLLKVLRAQFRSEVPPDLAEAVSRKDDLSTLRRWFDEAVAGTSPDKFRELVFGKK
jgi:hypothetical protein